MKAQPDADAIGMILTHNGVVRGTAHSGEPVRGMVLRADRGRLAALLTETGIWPGIFAVRAWVNEGRLEVGDDIMYALVAGDIRENVFEAMQRLVAAIKSEVLSESELR